MRRFTQIKDLSNRRRLPRLGKIRLGVKVETKDGKSYPKETPWFIVPPEVSGLYGEQPTELDVMIPVEDVSVAFPQAYEMYGSGRGLKCTGDGETAYRMNEETKAMEPRTCPCEYLEQKKCKQRAHLAVILPKVSMGGIFQIDTSSFNSIVDLNSSIDYVRGLVGRVAMVPLKLKREARETHHDGKKQVHYTMSLEFVGDITMVNQIREGTQRVLMAPAPVLPPPVLENPEFDEATVVEPDVVEPVVVTPAAPSLDVDRLLNQIGLAKSADEVNQALDLSNTLAVPEHKVKVRKAAAARMKELIK